MSMNIQMKDIQQLIDEPYLSRGIEYFNEGVVKIITLQETSVKARIVGSCVYNVTLIFKNKTLTGTCSCPAFSDFGPCKHMAATCMAVLEGVSRKPSKKASYQFAEYEDVERYLRGRRKEDLVELLLDIVGVYPEIIEEYYLINEDDYE